MASKRPEAPILDADPNDVKAFYHNVAYKVNRAAINLAKKEVWARGVSPRQRPAPRAGRAPTRLRWLADTRGQAHGVLQDRGGERH